MISSLTPEIIYEDKDIIVCHKPAGVPTQSSRIGTKDMVSILKNHLIKNTAKKPLHANLILLSSIGLTNR